MPEARLNAFADAREPLVHVNAVFLAEQEFSLLFDADVGSLFVPHFHFVRFIIDEPHFADDHGSICV